MAYSTSTAPGLISQKNGSNGLRVWAYKSADSLATVAAADYFSNGDDLGMVVGDQMIVINSVTGASNQVAVTQVTSGGAATIAGGTQELTASGAVTPGIRHIELNHASVIVAATIASADLHQGLLVVEDTSGSGTAAHTLTLTGGTFDGTNNTATLNAPAELLVVLIDGDGNGTIITNTGGVALSSV